MFAEIGRRLVVIDKTVRNHVSNVFAKLHVATRAEAVARAGMPGWADDRMPAGGRENDTPAGCSGSGRGLVLPDGVHVTAASAVPRQQ